MPRQKVKYLVIIFSVLIVTGPILDNWYSLVRHDPPYVGPLSPLQLIRGVIFIILLALLSNYTVKSIKGLSLIKPLLMISAFFILMLPFHKTPLENFIYIFQLFYIIAFMIGGLIIGISKNDSDDWLAKIGWYTLLIVVSIQLYVYYQSTIHYSIDYTYSEYALVGLGGRPGAVTSASASIIPILLLRIKKMSVYDWIFLTIAMISLTMTMRRSTILGVLIGFVIMVAVIIKYKNQFKYMNMVRLIMIFIIILSIGYGITLTPVADDFRTRIEGMNVFEGETGAGRLLIWEASINSIIYRSNLFVLLGEGIGNVHHAIGRSFNRAIDPHNIWIQMIIAGGLIGFVLLFWFHYKLILFVIKVKDYLLPSLIVAASVIIFWGLTSGNMFSPNWVPIYFLFGIVSGMRIKRYYSNLFIR